MKEPHEYSRAELERILRACLGHTLEEVDVNHVLTRGAGGNKGALPVFVCVIGVHGWLIWFCMVCLNPPACRRLRVM